MHPGFRAYRRLVVQLCALKACRMTSLVERYPLARIEPVPTTDAEAAACTQWSVVEVKDAAGRVVQTHSIPLLGPPRVFFVNYAVEGGGAGEQIL
jgi:hypothetical protein